MSHPIETSLTLVNPARGEGVDVHVFADANRYFPIHSRAIGDALREVASRDAPHKRIKVGGGASAVDVEFFVLDLWHDRAISRKLSNIIDKSFLDAVNHALKTAVGTREGLLSDDATTPLDEVSNVIELRRFVSNIAALKGSKRGRSELLFHYAANAAE